MSDNDASAYRKTCRFFTGPPSIEMFEDEDNSSADDQSPFSPGSELRRETSISGNPNSGNELAFLLCHPSHTSMTVMVEVERP